MKRFILISFFSILFTHLTFSQVKIDTVYTEKLDFMENLKINEFIYRECECFNKDSVCTDSISKILFCILYISNKNHDLDFIYKKQKISYIKKIGKDKWYREDYDLEGRIIEDYKFKISHRLYKTKAISVEVDNLGNINKINFDKYFKTIKIKNI